MMRVHKNAVTTVKHSSMQALAPETWQMWVTFGAIITAIVLYSTERLTLELTSLLVIGFFLVFFTFFPVDRC